MPRSLATIAPHVNSFVSCTDISIPEVLILRFAGNKCVKGAAGELWQQLYSVGRDVTDAVPRLFSAEIIKSLLSIAGRMSPGELQFRNINLDVFANSRTIEAQITVNGNGQYVLLLRDVTLASLAHAHHEQSSALVALLSPRELEVLRLVVDGETNKAVASKLQISEKTVEKHRSRIMEKTGARQVAELVRLTYPVFSLQKSA